MELVVDKLLARGKRVLVVLPAVYVASSGRIPNNVGSATTWREKSADDEVCTSMDCVTHCTCKVRDADVCLYHND